MNDNANEISSWLLNRIIERLEKSPIEFVETFIDLLAAPERKRDEELQKDLLVQVWFLVNYPASFPRSLHGTINTDSQLSDKRLAPYDQLIRVVRAMIESEIFRCLAPLAQEQSAKFDNRAFHYFWGGLTLHVKLSLLLEPHSGPSLFSKGYLTLPDGKSFFCESPLSESQIFKLLTQGGHSFVHQYVSSYFQHDDVRTLSFRFPEERLYLAVQERTLNRYVDKFSKRLAVQLHDGFTRLAEDSSGGFLGSFPSSSPNSIVTQLITDASSILFAEPIRDTSLVPVLLQKTTVLETEINSNRANGSESGTASAVSDDTSQLNHVTSNDALHSADSHLATPRELLTETLWEHIRRVQRTEICAGIRTVYIAQNLEYLDLEGGTRQPVAMDELVKASNKRIVLTAAPGGGKTRFQQELILYANRLPIYHIAINLDTYALSGIQSLHRFAALELLKLLGQPYSAMIRLAEELLLLDLEQRIWWHLDKWDDVSTSALAAISTEIAPLSQFTLSTSNPSCTVEHLNRSRATLDAIITIQPFTLEQIQEFIKRNFAKDCMRIQHRAFQLLGLARLPNGLEYICKYEHETIIETLLGYINCNLDGIGEPAIKPEIMVFSGVKEFEWQSESFVSAYSIVKPLASLALNRKNLPFIKPEELVPYMGTTRHEENQQLATFRIKQGVRAKLWMKSNETQSFQFIVPEVGLLLVAIALCSTLSGRNWLDYALGQFRQDPYKPLYQMMMTVAMWHQEKLFLSAPTVSQMGTMVPAKTADETRLLNSSARQVTP